METTAVASSVGTITVNVPVVVDAPGTSQVLFQSLFLPLLVGIAVGLATYWVTDLRAERRKKRSTSLLGVAVIDTLLEEVEGGIGVMTAALSSADDPDSIAPFAGMLPHQSWSGMSTIPDDVMVRIVELSRGQHFEGFQPKDIRTHCKNYFVHMEDTYRNTIGLAIMAVSNYQDWRGHIQRLVRDSRYLEAAEGVKTLLERTRALLEEDAGRASKTEGDSG